MANEFLVSVSNAVIRNPSTGCAIAFGKANLTSAFTMTTAATDVRGGINNPLLYTYIHDRNLEVKIEQAVFDQVTLGLNAGQLSGSAVVNVTQTDCIVLSGSSGSTSKTPVSPGMVTVFMPDGTVQTVTASTRLITVSGSAYASAKVDAVYLTSVTANQITINTITPPSVVDLTLISEVRDNTGTIVKYLQINIPRYQVDGNYTLSMTANGVSTQALNGKALANADATCASGEYYAKVTWVTA
jgi:hypothetical protein